MSATITHSTVVVVPDDGTSPVGSDEWNANHTLSNVAASDGTLAQFASTTSLELKGVISDETGSGALVFATSPTLVTPLLGTPTSGVLTNCTGTASGLTAGNVTTNANLTGDVTSVGNASTLATVNSNVGSFTSANITVNAKGLVTAAANGSGGSGLTVGTTAITSGTGSRLLYETSGNVVGEISGATSNGTALTLVAPVLGTPASGTLTSCTGLPPAGVVGTAAILGANTHTATQTINAANNTSALVVSGNSITGSNATPFLDVAGTWNGSGDVSGIKLNVTNTTTGSLSLLLNLSVAGAPIFGVRPNGIVMAPYLMTNLAGDGTNNWGPGLCEVSLGLGTGLVLASGNVVVWSDNVSSLAGSVDMRLARVGAQVLGLFGASTAGATFELTEMTAPSAGAVNTCRVYAEDNGSGKTRLMAIFNTGAAQQIAIQP